MNPGIEIIRFAVAVYANRDEAIDEVPIPLDQPCHLARVKPSQTLRSSIPMINGGTFPMRIY